jgi:hypothetical protein
VEKLARLNEIQHRVSSAVVGVRGSGKDWLTGAFSQLVASHVAEDKELLTLVERVVERTYTRVTQASEQAAEQGVAPDANAANVQLT